MANGNINNKSVSWWKFALFIPVLLYFVLDADPSLFLYDQFLTLTRPEGDRYARLNDKTIWIVGASSGIGANLTCHILQQSKAKHIILSSRRYEKLVQVANECSERTTTSPTVSIVEYDALNTEPNATKEIVQMARSSSPTGSIDVLILNAGIYQSKLAVETPMEEVRRLFNVNVFSPIQLAMETIEQDRWKERQYGQIVLVSSIMSRGPQSLSTAYAASKSASRNFFQSLSTEEWTWLQVNVALPGATRTSFWAPMNESNKKGNDAAKVIRPDDGTLMDPSRVAQLILTGMVGSPILFYEMWICQYSGLLYVYVASYAPWIHNVLGHLAGLVRLAAAKHEHIDLLELTGVLSRLFWMAVGRYP